MNTRAQHLAASADKRRCFVLFSTHDEMRTSRTERNGIIELGVRSIRNFYGHSMAAYAAALAYRGLFGLFPFLLILVVLAGALGLPDFFFD